MHREIKIKIRSKIKRGTQESEMHRLASGAGLGLMCARLMPAQNKILLVDDDEQMLELYQALLEQIPSHPEVQVCNTGARAIAMLESEPFTLLITDLRMPKMDGLQVLAIVRR